MVLLVVIIYFELHESGRPVNPLRLISNTFNNVKTNSIEVQYLNAKQNECIQNISIAYR